jgi:hypothetical protein
MPIMNDATKRLLKDQFLWIGIYFGIAIAVTVLLDFPYSLVVILAIVIPLSLYRRRRILRKTGMKGGSFFGGFGSRAGLKYYCISCGTKHNDAQCPNCGSRMKKGAFD